jgi:hypothetical protein
MTSRKDIVRSDRPAGQGPLATPQRAASRLQFGERFSAVAEVEVTPAGMLAIGAMVGAILLGSAVIVRAARRAPPKG